MIRIFISEQIPLSKEEFNRQVAALPFGYAEKERLLKIKNESAARASLSAYVALSKLTDGKDSLKILRSTNGKPYFEAHRDLPFSISHSSQLSVAAVGDALCGSIGIDIEFVRKDFDFEKLSKRFFTDSDRQKINGIDDFTVLWTLKEAYSKMLGGKLCENLARETIDINRQTFKAEYNGQTAYLTLSAEKAFGDNETKIFSSCQEIIIKKI